jgi:hypothetical protein
MSPRLIQRILAAVYLGLGAWCLLWPQSIQDLSLRTEFRSEAPALNLTLACFGAQAMLTGLLAATARFTRTTFLWFGLATLPFFVFNYYFYFVVPMFTEVMAVDFVGNIVLLSFCTYGYLKSPPETA